VRVLIVRAGKWIYDGSAEKPVDIVAFDFDWWYEFARSDDSLDEGEEPQPLGRDGLLYYVRFRHAGEDETPTSVDSTGYLTIEDAMAHASDTVPSPIAWST
jgi:hypothetical protein